jgi:hypothetical protein
LCCCWWCANVLQAVACGFASQRHSHLDQSILAQLSSLCTCCTSATHTNCQHVLGWAILEPRWLFNMHHHQIQSTADTAAASSAVPVLSLSLCCLDPAVLQFLGSPFLLWKSFVSGTVSCAMYAVSLSYYHYLNFLGYSALPFLERTEVGGQGASCRMGPGCRCMNRWRASMGCGEHADCFCVHALTLAQTVLCC